MTRRALRSWASRVDIASAKGDISRHHFGINHLEIMKLSAKRTFQTLLPVGALCAVFAAITVAQNDAAPAPDATASDGGSMPWETIFDGKSLKGWDGNADFWSVEDGAITGQTTSEKPTKGNTFIIWRGGDVAW